jgi:hypothetical protein
MSSRSTLWAGLAAGLVALVIVHVALRDTYWDYSEGVYAYSAHLMLHGHRLYGQLVGAQPPGVFVVGAVLLGVHDSLEWLRFAVACLQLGAGLLAAQLVWRITGSRAAAILTPAAALLTPWAVHEHGALTPELVALPVLVGAALASVERRAAVTGVLCGLLPLIKVPYVIPAVVLVACCGDWRRAARWAAPTLAVGAGLTTLFGGVELWRDAIYAQTQSGYRTLGILKGFWAQAGWNLLGLLIPTALVVRYRRAAADQHALGIAIALAVAMIATFFTNIKQGTGLNITVPVEMALLPLAISGAALARRSTQALAVGALAFTLAQSVSLMASPHHPQPFLRLASRPAWGAVMTAGELHRAVAQARACPRTMPYGGPPLIAWLSGHRMPADQPDQFIVQHAAVLHSVRAATIAALPACYP